MHFRRIKQLAVEGLAMTAVVAAGLVVGSRVLNSSLAARVETVPVVGVVVTGPKAVVNAIVKPTS
ncbi:MAG: hypothetical protein ACYDCL_21445 [Myxococcales bacterium]